MAGVEILSQSIIYEVEVPLWPLIVFPIVGLLIGLIFAIIDWVNFGFDPDWLSTILLLMLACFIIGCNVMLLAEHETDEVDYIEYKVTIEDSVSLNEFLDKYEILGQEGRIYTVKEKTK